MSSFVFEGRGRPGFVVELEALWERREESVDVKARLVEEDISFSLGFDLDLLW